MIFYFAILLFVISQDISALLQHQNFHRGARVSRYVFKVSSGQINYDPFESDPRMRGLIASELLTIKSMNSTSIKTELTSMGVQSRTFVDKSVLESILAKERVKLKIKKRQESEQIARMRGDRADLIDNEISKIRKSGMPDISMARELQSLNVVFDMSGDLVYQLALARLGIPTPAEIKMKFAEPKKSADSEEIVALREVATDVKEVYTRFVENVGAIIPSEIANVTYTKNQQILNEKLSSAQEFVKNIGLTKMEQQAQALTSEISSNAEAERGTSGKVIAIPLSETEIIEQLAVASKLSTFDDVMRWARNKTRSEIAQLLVYRGMEVPEYSPRSSLAAILADSLLVDRTNSGVEHFDEDNDFGRNFIPTGHVVDTRDNQRPVSSRAYPDGERTRRVSPGAGRRTRKKYPDGSQMTSFFFEKELFGKFTRFFSRIVNDVVGQAAFNDIGGGGKGTQFIRFLSRMTALGCNTALSAAAWAGGEVLPPGQVLFIGSAYSILFRKGIPSFFGSFLVIRILRELVFVRETFQDSDQPAIDTAQST